jgi:hypothetical protein
MKHLNKTRVKYGFKTFSGGILLFCSNLVGSWACNGGCLIRNGIWFSAFKSKRDPTKCLEDRKHTSRSSLIDQSLAILRVALSLTNLLLYLVDEKKWFVWGILWMIETIDIPTGHFPFISSIWQTLTCRVYSNSHYQNCHSIRAWSSSMCFKIFQYRVAKSTWPSRSFSGPRIRQ